MKLHKMPNGARILAMCDTSLLGKRFEENDLQLDLTTDFYKGREMHEKDILALINSANIFNFVGDKAVSLGIKAGLIHKKNIIIVNSIPHAQAVRT